MRDLQIFLCRHGETEWTVSGQHTGLTDIGLTETGRAQALSLKERLDGLSFNKVFTSPLKRAIETSQLALPGHAAILDPDLKEWDYGSFEGMRREEIALQNPSWELFAQGCPGGESPKKVSQRADRFIQTCLSQSGKIAVFSHGHFLRTLAVRWIGLGIGCGKLFSLSVASLSILGYEHQKEPVVSLWNDTSHWTRVKK